MMCGKLNYRTIQTIAWPYTAVAPYASHIIPEYPEVSS